MSARAAYWLAWSLWALTVVFVVLSLFMPNEQNGLNILVPLGAWLVASSTVGAVIVSQRPENLIGWIQCAIGFLFASNVFSGLYAFRALVSRPGSLPAGEVAAWFSAWTVNPAYLLFLYLFLLFPDGRSLSQRWRPLLWIIGILGAMSILVGALHPGPIEGLEPVRNPLGIEAASEILVFAGDLLFYLFTALLLASAVCVYFRFRHARGPERQQIKWLAYAAALLGVTAIVGAVGDLLLGSLGGWFFLVIVAAFFGIPLSIGVAILRYRLYDIDLVINRTLVYGTLTVLLAVVYFGGVSATEAIFRTLTGQQEQPQLAVVVSTLVIAALFTPLRRRIQGFIDRRFYRRKYDAAKTLEAFSAKLRDETELDTLRDDLVGVVRETMQPAHVSLWLRPDTAPQREQAD